MQRNFNYRSLLLLCFGIASLSASTQYSPSEMDHLILKYPKTNMVMLHQGKTYTIKAGKEGLDITLETLQEQLITKSGMFHSSAEELWSDSSFMELVDFNAYSLVPEKNKYKKQQVKQYFNSDEVERSLFTTDSKKTEFYFPNTAPRSITHLDYKMQLKDPHFLSSMFTRSFYPIEKLDLRIIVDNDIDLELLYFNISADSLDQLKTVTVGKKTTEYHWRFNAVPELEYYSNAPNVKWYLPHIMPKIKGYHTAQGYKPVLTSVDDLFSLYQTWIGMIEDEDLSELKPVVEELVAGADNDLEKLERIYHWVQENIKYIAFTDGMEGLVPRSATNVVNCRFGDCKGMTNLMHNMANLANVKTQRTWIGTRDIPYSYSQVGSPSVDNHMILSYVTPDTVIFMDATSSETPFGFPTAFIQEKEALIALNQDNYKIHNVPVVQANSNSWLDTLFARIEGTDLVGRSKTRISGYHATRWQRITKNANAKDRDEFYRHYFEKGDNRFEIENVLATISENKKDIDVEYEFRIPNYLIKVNEELFLNLNLEKEFASDPIEENREIPVEMNNTSSQKHVIVLEIPEGYVVDHIPDDSEMKEDQFGYSMDYSKIDDQVIFEMNTFTNELILAPETFEPWNEITKHFKRDIRQNLVIKALK